MNLPTIYKLASPFILRSFRKKNVRTLACLKQYVSPYVFGLYARVATSFETGSKASVAIFSSITK